MSFAEDAPKKPKIGRPLIKNKIQEIIQLLDEENKINPASSIKAIGELIFSRGKITYPPYFMSKDGKVKPGRSTIEKEYNNYKRNK